MAGHQYDDFNPIAETIDLIYGDGEELTYTEMDQRVVDMLSSTGASDEDVETAFGVWLYYMNHDPQAFQPPKPSDDQENVMVRLVRQAKVLQKQRRH